MRLTLLGIAIFCCFFRSPDFHELWHSHNECLSFTEVKWQWATFVQGCLTTRDGVNVKDAIKCNRNVID